MGLSDSIEEQNRTEIEILRAENEKLRSKKHITLTQAREMALFTVEKARQRAKWENMRMENKWMEETLRHIAENGCPKCGYVAEEAFKGKP